ncbi:MAG: mechanosensitive ion channel [bacterium]|nr:mechanosensitive ion channel [bacterium]
MNLRALALGFIVFFSLILSFTSLGAQEYNVGPNSLESQETIETAPVILDGNELFSLRGTRTYPAERRARQVAERIIQVAQDPKIPVESIVAVPQPNAVEIKAGKKRILYVFDVDAKIEALSLPTMGEAVLRLIQESVKNYREDRKPQNLRRGLYLSLAATAILLVIWFLFRWIFGKFQGVLSRKAQAAGDKILKLKSMEIIEAGRFWKGIRTVLSGIHLTLALLVLFIYLEFVLGNFPWTRFISNRLMGLIANPLRTIGNAILDYIPNIFFLIVLTGLIYLLIKFVKTVFSSIERGTFYHPGFEAVWARPTYRLLRLMILAISVVIAYPYIPGSDSDAFKGVSIFIGLLVSLGSSSAIANLIAGYSLIYRRAFQVGDRIQIGEVTGDVTEMRLLVTHLHTIKNEEVTVPNSLVLASNVINFSRLAQTKGLILHTTVGIGYETPWRQVEAMLIRAAQRTPELLKDPRPFVLATSLGDFCVN